MGTFLSSSYTLAMETESPKRQMQQLSKNLENGQEFAFADADDFVCKYLVQLDDFNEKEIDIFFSIVAKLVIHNPHYFEMKINAKVKDIASGFCLNSKSSLIKFIDQMLIRGFKPGSGMKNFILNQLKNQDEMQAEILKSIYIRLVEKGYADIAMTIELADEIISCQHQTEFWYTVINAEIKSVTCCLKEAWAIIEHLRNKSVVEMVNTDINAEIYLYRLCSKLILHEQACYDLIYLVEKPSKNNNEAAKLRSDILEFCQNDVNNNNSKAAKQNCIIS